MNERGQHMLNFANNFFDYIEAHGTPLDFFTWHAYGLDTERIADCTKLIDKLLAEHGYKNAENHLNEWTVKPMSKTRGTPTAAARAMVTMCRMQDLSPEILCIYDGRLANSGYSGFFNQAPFRLLPLFHAYKAFNELYKLGGHVNPVYDLDGFIYAQAATDGEKKAFIITNTASEAHRIETNLDESMRALVIDELHDLSLCDVDPTSFQIGANTVILFINCARKHGRKAFRQIPLTMNVFLVGNGHDLHHKFPTGYINFLNTIRFLSEKYDETFNTVGKVFGNEELQERDPFIKECYQKHKIIYDATPLQNEKMDNLISCIKDNMWIKYFCNSVAKDIKWIDFEKEIIRVLNAFSNFFDYEGSMRLTGNRVIFNFSEFPENVEDIIDKNQQISRNKYKFVELIQHI
ncbi:MAG: hypothetical protein IJZ08_06140 [Clostridia bacterium]|nr:hypothetical protein [Clostridia bacterium]